MAGRISPAAGQEIPLTCDDALPVEDADSDALSDTASCEPNDDPSKARAVGATPATAASGALAFVPDDSTTEVPHPVRRVLLLPEGTSVAHWLMLPHPRHAQVVQFCCVTSSAAAHDAAAGPEGATLSPVPPLVLCDVQQWRHSFDGMWFIGDFVEPNGALLMITPFDWTFFAVALAAKQATAVRAEVACQLRDAAWAPASILSGGGHPPAAGEHDERAAARRSTTTFRDFHGMVESWPELRGAVLAMDPGVSKWIWSSLEAALETVCDVTDVDGTPYYRINVPRICDWTLVKVRGVEREESFQRLILESKDAEVRLLLAAADQVDSSDEGAPPTSTSSGESADLLRVLRRKAVALLNDALPPELHDAVAARSGVDMSPPVVPTHPHPSSLLTSTSDTLFDDDASPAKKARSDSAVSVKSANVKRLEKAGPPKGTPTIMSFFKSVAKVPVASGSEKMASASKT